MQLTNLVRIPRILTCAAPILLLAGCLGTGDGKVKVPGTPPGGGGGITEGPPVPTVTCTELFSFEDDCGTVPFEGFGGGDGSIGDNPDRTLLNASLKVGVMRKFAGEVFGGTTLDLPGDFNFADGAVFRMKTWSPRPVPVLFKFEGLNQERSVAHSGSGSWEELCYDFTGTTSGPAATGLTLIFDLGVAGQAGTNPTDWTFYFDDITQSDTSCGGGADALDFPVDFEGDPTAFDFGEIAGFGGGATVVVDNPVPGGINTSDQVARMQKFAAEPFGGSTLDLRRTVDFSEGEVFKMKVWSLRDVPVLFKFEGLEKERVVNHDGGMMWQELCFDFSGDTAGPVSSQITFIFENGVNGDAEANPDFWTFYMDDITQTSTCGDSGDNGDTGGIGDTGGNDDNGDTGGGETGVVVANFEGDPDAITFSNFGGGEGSVVLNPFPEGNESDQVGRMLKFSDQVFAGTTLSLDGNLAMPADAIFTMKVWSQRSVRVLFKLEDGTPPGIAELEVTHSGSGWETLTFDFAGVPANVTDGISLFFDIGDLGAVGEADLENWTFYFDDIRLTNSNVGVDDGSGGNGGGPGDDQETVSVTAVDFETAETGLGFTWTVFENGENSLPLEIVHNPDTSGINTSATVGKFTSQSTGTEFNGVETNRTGDFELKLDSTNSIVKMMVYKEVISNVGIKFSDPNGGSTGQIVVANTKINEWEELTFDFRGVMDVPENQNIVQLVVFPDIRFADADNVIYFDNIRLTGVSEDTGNGDGSGGTGDEPFVLLDPAVDFETAETGTGFNWFVFENDGDETLEIVSNPSPDATNSSSTVGKVTARANGAQFAGVETNRNLNRGPIDFGPITLDETNSIIKVMVFKDIISDVGLKFAIANGGGRPEIKVPNTLVGQWEELTFDVSENIGEFESIDIVQLILFPDFRARDADTVVYFDNIRFTDGSE